MNRIIVSIISEQTIPNYLFIKEMFQDGDSLLFISSRKFQERITWIQQTLKIADDLVQSIIFPEGGEERWNDMDAELTKVLSPECDYMVNLTGGTKYMTLLVLSVFEKYRSRFFYIPFPQNTLLEPLKNDSISLTYRLRVDEYLSNYHVTFTEKKLTESEEYCDYLFERFLNGSLNYKLIDDLRSYRNVKKKAIFDIENCIPTERYPRIEGLNDFLTNIQFPIEDKGFLKKNEFEYLTGGWFEEFVYYKIQRYVNPQDIKLGVLIKRTENRNQNDLDVVFTSGNKLFVIECKTGIAGVKMFNETVYKATAIKEAVLGLSANTFIVSLVPKNEDLEKTARNMGIHYKCREDITGDRMMEFINQIKNIAKD